MQCLAIDDTSLRIYRVTGAAGWSSVGRRLCGYLTAAACNSRT
jgi:hypothetical protein